MANKNMFLYWGSGSAPCWKPMLVLAEKGLWDGCPNKLVSFSNKEHKGEEVLKLNPRGQVPTFKDGDDVVINESGAICMYLEDKYSNDSNRLIPSDVTQRAQVYQKMFESDNIRPNITTNLVYYKWITQEKDWDQKLLSENVEKAKVELGYWNTGLDGKEYLCGSTFTMADVFFYPFIAFLVRSGAKLTEFPDLKAYYDRVSARPTVQSTWPPHWKDGPGKEVLQGL